MSKKIATGSDALVMDVKCGEGAFMKTEEEAARLAESLVSIGQLAGIQVIALITDMNQPLGEKIGNALEIEECIDLLKGQGPADLEELTLAIASQMLVLGKKASTIDQAHEILREKIESGQALETFKAMIRAQGGDPGVVDDPTLMPRATYQIEIRAPQAGYIQKIQADALGIVSMKLGGGREKAGDPLDYGVGLVLDKKVGDFVDVGDRLLTLHSNKEDIGTLHQEVLAAYQIGEATDAPALIKGTMKA